MNARPQVWIPTIIGLFVVTFLVGFQPIRRPPQQAAPQATFSFQFDKPLTTMKSEYPAKVKEIKGVLARGGFTDKDVETVDLVANDRVRIKTWAVDSNMMAQDEKNLLAALQKEKKYQGVKSLGLQQKEEGETEKPIAMLGTALAVYRPVPKVKLGLDLQGGLHLVLRCLPYASMTFTTEEGKKQDFYAAPLPPPAPGAQAPKPAPGAPTMTREELQRRILTELIRVKLVVQKDVETGYVKVNPVSPSRILVETNAADEPMAKSQRKQILGTLQQLYPTYAVNGSEVDCLPIGPDTADKVKDIIDRRLFDLGEIREPVIQKQGRDQIIVEIPGVKDPDRVTEILKTTALLEFRLIPAQYHTVDKDVYDEWKDQRTQETVNWDRVLAESTAEFRGADLIANSKVEPGKGAGDWVVTFELRADKKRAFNEFTRKNVKRLMAIVLDGKCQMAPEILGAIPGQGIIEGRFDTDEAAKLRLLLNAGALPVPLEIAENRTVSATLGQDTITKALRAGFIGLAAVMCFMMFYYRVPGVLATIALFLYVLIVIAVTAGSQLVRGVGGITLTLPGIAGVILSIGMAVDANVLIFERLKEEIRTGKSMRAAIVAGFERAWTAILDSNVTSIISASVLYFLGTSVIKSFATMLLIGVLCSLFTAITVSRWMVTMVGETKLGRNPKLFGVTDMPDRS